MKYKLNAQVTILAARDLLFMTGPKGDREVRARGIDYLHQNLTPYLEQGVDPNDLLASIPESHHGLVNSYLNSLREGGAITDPRLQGNEPKPLFDARDDERLHFEDEDGGQRRLFRVGYIDFFTRADIAVFLVSNHHAGRAVLHEKLLGKFGRNTCLLALPVDDHQVVPIFRKHRDFFSRLVAFLASRLQEQDYPDGSLTIYKVDVETYTVQQGLFRDLSVEETAKDLSPSISHYTGHYIPSQMHLVRPGALPQLPLLNIMAKHDFYPGAIMRFGLEPDRLRKLVLRDFLARTTKSDGSVWSMGLTEHVRFFKTDQGLDSSRLVAHFSPIDLILQLLSNWESTQAHPEIGVLDLLAPEFDLAELSYLQGLLRRKLKNLSVRYQYGRNVHILSTEHHRVASYHQYQAFLEMLLRETARVYYHQVPAENAVDRMDHLFASPRFRRAILRHALRDLSQIPNTPRLLLNRDFRWGNSLVAGELYVH